MMRRMSRRMKMKHLIKIDISIFPSFVDQHLVGGSVYVNHFLLLGVSPPPPNYTSCFRSSTSFQWVVGCQSKVTLTSDCHSMLTTFFWEFLQFAAVGTAGCQSMHCLPFLPQIGDSSSVFKDTSVTGLRREWMKNTSTDELHLWQDQLLSFWRCFQSDWLLRRAV